MRAVNLLPADQRRKGLEEGARTPLLLAVGGIVLVTIAATFFASMASSDASGTRSDVEAVEATIDALPDPAKGAVSEGMLVEERSNRIAALASALSNRVPFDNLLRQISFVLPEDAWLTQFDAKAPVGGADTAAAPAADAGQDVTIQGGTWAHEQVAVVLARLAALPVLEDVRLTGSTRTEPSEGAIAAPGQPLRPFVTFVISASLRTAKTESTEQTDPTDTTEPTETTEETS
jgi:Tfp pilus assembly protein PilN